MADEKPKVIYSFLSQLSESRLVPSIRTLVRYDAQEIADLAFLTLVSLRILRAEPSSQEWASRYGQRTASTGTFAHWRTDATDLHCLLYALSNPAAKLADDDAGAFFRRRLDLSPARLLPWLRLSERDEALSHRFFVSLDSLLHVTDGSMRAIRRMAMDWPKLSRTDKRLTMTRLLQMLRARAPSSEILPHLDALARSDDLEMADVRNLDEDTANPTPPRQGRSLLWSLAVGLAAGLATGLARRQQENASGGATGAASIASVAGGLGSGFDPAGDRGIYGPAKKPVVLRRPLLDSPKKKKRP